MPRQARVKGEFSSYHIIQRGNDKKEIFLSDNDKRKFISILQKAKTKYNFLIYAYCLMDNHVHLLIKDNGNDISKVIKSINVSYVLYFNRKYHRCGHLFQNRFISDIIKDDRQLMSVSKYIHNNPVKAKMVQRPEAYLWSSYYSYVNIFDDLVDINLILDYISDSRQVSLNEYIKYVNNEDNDNDSNTSIQVKNTSPTIENNKFISSFDEAFIELNQFLRINKITMEACLAQKLIRNQLICYLRKNSSLTLREIGDLVGGLGESAISKILNKYDHLNCEVL